MRFQGKLYKDGKFWLAEVPIFAALTQGRTRKEAETWAAYEALLVLEDEGVHASEESAAR